MKVSFVVVFLGTAVAAILDYLVGLESAMVYVLGFFVTIAAVIVHNDSRMD